MISNTVVIVIFCFLVLNLKQGLAFVEQLHAKHPLFHFLPTQTFENIRQHTGASKFDDVLLRENGSNPRVSSSNSNASSSCGSKRRCGGPPLVIFPSLIGNQLDATLHRRTAPHFWCWKNWQEYQIWLVLYNFVPHSPTQYCMWSNLNLTFNGKTVLWVGVWVWVGVFLN
jgi:hypothetical protein